MPRVTSDSFSGESAEVQRDQALATKLDDEYSEKYLDGLTILLDYLNAGNTYDDMLRVIPDAQEWCREYFSGRMVAPNRLNEEVLFWHPNLLDLSLPSWRRLDGPNNFDETQLFGDVDPMEGFEYPLTWESEDETLVVEMDQHMNDDVYAFELGQHVDNDYNFADAEMGHVAEAVFSDGGYQINGDGISDNLDLDAVLPIYGAISEWVPFSDDEVHAFLDRHSHRTYENLLAGGHDVLFDDYLFLRGAPLMASDLTRAVAYNLPLILFCLASIPLHEVVDLDVLGVDTDDNEST